MKSSSAGSDGWLFQKIVQTGFPLRHGLYKPFLFSFSFCAISVSSYLDCYYLDKILTVESHARYTVWIKPVLNLVFFKSKRESPLQDSPFKPAQRAVTFYTYSDLPNFKNIFRFKWNKQHCLEFWEKWIQIKEKVHCWKLLNQNNSTDCRTWLLHHQWRSQKKL